MTKEKFDSLTAHDTVWFSPPFFAYPFPGVIRKRRNGATRIWINFFGTGQCEFTPTDYDKDFYNWVSQEGPENPKITK